MQLQVFCTGQEFMFEFQGTMYFFRATQLIGLDKLNGEVSLESWTVLHTIHILCDALHEL